MAIDVIDGNTLHKQRRIFISEMLPIIYGIISYNSPHFRCWPHSSWTVMCVVHDIYSHVSLDFEPTETVKPSTVEYVLVIA